MLGLVGGCLNVQMRSIIGSCQVGVCLHGRKGECEPSHSPWTPLGLLLPVPQPTGSSNLEAWVLTEKGTLAAANPLARVRRIDNQLDFTT